MSSWRAGCMVLATAEGRVGAPHDCPQLVERLMGLPSLAGVAARFAGLPLRTVTAADHCCCVLQGEVACVDLHSAPAAPALVGSGEATTCVVAIIVSARPARVCVAHFDASCLRQPAPAPAALEVRPALSAAALPAAAAPAPGATRGSWGRQGATCAELFLVGGFPDANGLGRATLARVLGAFHRHPATVLLRLACVAGLNCRGGAPRCCGAVYDVARQAVQPGARRLQQPPRARCCSSRPRRAPRGARPG